MKSPHILFIARRFPPSVGGMERFAYDLSRALAQELKVSPVTWGKQTRFSVIFGLPYLFFKAFWRLLSLRDITVLHAQDGVTSPLAWLLSKLFNKPYVVVIHGLDMTYENRFYQTVNIWFIRHADKVIAISDPTREEALKRGIDADKVIVIPLGVVETPALAQGSKQEILASIGLERLANKRILLTVGRLVKRKGVAWFINEVLPGLYKENPNLCYVVIGDGSDRESVENAIKKQNLEAAVILLGSASDSTKHILYTASDVFVMPNIPVKGDMEGFGIVALEAAAAGLPVVASDLEGITNALQDKKNGWLIPPGDGRAYEKAITQLLSDETIRRSVGQQAREYTLENFGWETIAESYRDIYQNLALKRPRQNIKFILSILILLITFIAFLIYVRYNRSVISMLFHVNPLALLLLIGLYCLQFGSLIAVLYFSIAFYRKKLSLRDTFLISSYSALTNFFGPTQAGSGVRAVYLKAKLGLKVKDFVFVSLIYYAIYASLSMVMLLAGAGRWLWALLATSGVILVSGTIIRWYKKRQQLRWRKLNPRILFGITLATIAQLFAQSIIYFVEILSVHPAASYAQAVSFTGAANFSLFVSLTPGAIGIREAFLLFSQSLHHIDSHVIVSAGVLDRAIYIVFLGLLFLSVIGLHGRRKFQEFRDSSE